MKTKTSIRGDNNTYKNTKIINQISICKLKNLNLLKINDRNYKNKISVVYKKLCHKSKTNKNLVQSLIKINLLN